MADDLPPQDWPSPGDPDEMFELVVERGDRLASRRRTLTVVAAVGALLVGLVGYGMGRSGAVGLREDRAVEVPDGTLAYYSCPGLTPLGELHRGDRVLVTGRDLSGRWAEIRSPLSLDERAWVRLGLLELDETPNLLVRDCIDPVTGEIAPPPTEPEETTTTSTSTTTTTSTSTTTTTVPETTTSTSSTTTTTTSTTVPAPTTTAAPPAPAIGQITRNPDVIVEQNPGTCAGSVTATISAPVQNVTGATLIWSVGPTNGSRAMSIGGGNASGTVGPFSQGTVGLPEAPIQVTVRATGPGGTTERTTTVSLRRCE